VNIIDFALASQDARLAALRAQAQAPSAEAIKAATLGALLRVEVDPLGWANIECVADAIEAAWEAG
jgi:hypothetical protein